MRILVNSVRIIVGLLFLLYGIGELNDSVGFSFKIQEYFGPALLNYPFVADRALLFAVLIGLFNTLLGLMLLLGYFISLTRWLALIATTTWWSIMFYIGFQGHDDKCACFGELLALNPWQSFSFGFVVFLLTWVIVVRKDLIASRFRLMTNKWIIFLGFIGSLWFGYHTLMHLPVKDFSAYSIGNPLSIEFFPPDSTLISETEEEPMTKDSLIPPALPEKALFVISYALENSESPAWPKIKELTDQALADNFVVIGLTSSSKDSVANLREREKLNFEFYPVGLSTAKKMIRSNPGVLRLEDGIIRQKKHWNDTRRIRIK